MPFTNDILKYSSCSIIGMAKNCGKTVVLNHILSRLQKNEVRIAVTSIGVDGEKTDTITSTAKPEIMLEKGTLFATSEMHYNQRRLISQIIDSTEYPSPLGVILIGEVLEKGCIIISGPSDMYSTPALINDFHRLGAGLVLVDGALSRKTSASPAVTDSMILCTGAALTLNIEELVRQTDYTYQLISLRTIDIVLAATLDQLKGGVWGITVEGELSKGADTLFEVKEKLHDLVLAFHRLFFAGILTNNVLETIMSHPKAKDMEIIVRDFTKIFITRQVFNKFIAQGGKIRVLHQTKLIAVCVNPISPTGHMLHSGELVDRLHQRLGVGVYDVKKIC